MGSYSGGYHGLMARLDAERGEPTFQQARQIVQNYLDNRNGVVGAPFVPLDTLDWSLPVLLAALQTTPTDEASDGR